MAHLLILFTILVSTYVDSTVPAVAKSRRGRQWIGQLEIQSDCTFPVEQNKTISPVDQVSLCNFTTSGPLDGVYSWRKGLASMANWLGGPKTDASNTTDGGYAYFETSSLAVQQLPGIQAKAWLKSPVYQATTPNGHCLRFAYNIQGASASQLRLLRVQMVPLEGHGAAPSHTTAPLIVNSILMPTLASRQQHQRQTVSDDVLASPWTPFRTIIMNHTGWQEVVDEVWLSSDSTRGQWIDGHVTYSSPYPHAFIFEAVPDLAHLQYRGHVAVDNIEFSTGPCSAECEFNSDFCQWSNDPESDFDWSLSRGSLWTSTGPIRDQLSSKYNFNFGGYAFIDSRLPHFAGSRASLTSHQLTASNALCFVFWVHMFGAGIGRLRLFQKADSNSSSNSLEREIWELSQSGPRDSWYRAQVTLASSSPFQIRLEASVGESGYGDIAVDSFRIENGSCPGLPEGSVNKGVDCTFQNGNCGWVLTNSQPGITSMWTRSSADILSGRPDGHSQQNVLSQTVNNYMLFDTYQNGHKPGSRGFVSSPLQSSNESHCLSFWFYLASASPSNPRLGALEVVLFEPNNTSNATTNVRSSIISTTLWRLENHQEEKWLFAQVPFVAVAGGYVSFVGVKGEGVRGIIALDDITLYRSTCSILPLEAAVSRLDCSFDSNLCNWNVDSQTVQLAAPNSTNVENSTDKEEETTTAAPDTFFSRLHPQDLPELQAENEPSIIFPTDEGSSTTEYDVSLPPTTVVDPPLPSTDGSVLVELIPGGFTDPIETTPLVDTSSTLSFESVVTQTTTTTFQPTSIETTSSASTTDVAKTNPSDKIKLVVSENGNKDMRGVSGLYDEITSFGPNTIEVISTSRDGATKSIIISQPVRNNRFRRSAHNRWIGYNQPRNSRIVHYGNKPEETVWRRPLPVPHWLRSHRPDFSDERDHARGQISPYSFHPAQRTGPKQPTKLFTVSSFAIASPVRPIAESTSTDFSLPVPVNREDPRWILASLSSSLYGIRDHTLQLSEGGYVYFEGKGKPSVSRLFSPEIPGNVTQCLSFFFTMAYNSPNSTLTVYRFMNGPLEELWRVTSTALDRSAARSKSPWIPARVPISSSGEDNQTIVIEGSTDIGGIGLDDIRLQQISCSSRP